MSGLRHTADEVNPVTGQDFVGSINDSANHFEDSGHRHTSDPSLVHTCMLLESQFETTQQTLVALQKQAMKHLQQFCIDVVCNQASSKASLTKPTTVSAWSDQQMTLPGSLQQSPKCMQMPGAAADYVPKMPETSDTEDTASESPKIIEVEAQRPQPGTMNLIRRANTGRIFTPPAASQQTKKTRFSTVAELELEEDKPRTVARTSTSVAKTSSMWSYDSVDEVNSERSFADFKAKRKATHHAQDLAMVQIQKRKKTGYDPTQNPAVQKAVFADAAAMKAKVKENIMQREYNVAQFYKTEGFAQQIARSAAFENITLAVIFLNALWVWIDTDYNNAPTLAGAHPIFQVGENLFCVYFAAELLIRFLAFQVKSDGLRDAWFVFDSVLVVVMILETWVLNLTIWMFNVGNDAIVGNASVLRLVRLLRIFRMARMARLLHALPELMILVKGISVAARSVLFTLLLLIVILYIFAIVFRQLCAENELEDSHFKTVPEAMNTLLLKGVLPDQGGLVTELGNVNLLYGAVCILFVLLSSLTIINMLIGVLCEVVGVVSSVEKEQMMLNFVKTKLLSLIGDKGVDKDDNLCISRDEFEALLLLPEGARVIQEVGVDVVVLVDLLDDIFTEECAFSFADVMELVLQLRGSNTATVRDVVDLRKFLTQLATDSHDHIIERMTDVVAQTVYQIVEQQLEQKLNHKSV